MNKRKEIIEMLKQIKPLLVDGEGPTSIFLGGKVREDYRNLNISDLVVDKACITVTTCKYILKRKYYIGKDEI